MPSVFTTASAAVLAPFVLLLAFALGAGAYEHRIVMPRWLPVDRQGARHWPAAAAKADDVGRRFWPFVTTLPLTLLALANAWLAWQAIGAARPWWLAAVALTLVERGLTFGYFIPTMLRLLRLPDSPAAAADAARWAAAGHLRHALLLAAAVAALAAFAALPRG
jgi:hypothetical protein